MPPTSSRKLLISELILMNRMKGGGGLLLLCWILSFSVDIEQITELVFDFIVNFLKTVTQKFVLQQLLFH